MQFPYSLIFQPITIVNSVYKDFGSGYSVCDEAKKLLKLEVILNVQSITIGNS